MRILFLTDNFPPEVNAPANRTYEHCSEWIKNNAKVTVITCAPNFPHGKVYKGYKNKLFQSENFEDVKVIRVWSYITANQGFTKRILDYISYAFSAFFAGLFYKTDIVIATSPQFFTAVSGYMLGAIKRKPWIMEVRDLWPESIKAVNALEDSRTLRFLEKVELFLYKKAAKIVVVTNAFRDNLVSRGVQDDKVEVVKNGVKLNRFKPLEKNQRLLEELNLEGKFVVGYYGTHGLAHKLDFILDCARNIEHDHIHFLFVGDGAEKAKLLELKKKWDLKNVSMLPSVSKDEIIDFISVADVALVPLKKSETFKTVIPSKIFENAALGKPILLGVEGESKEIIKKYHAGICFEPENREDFIEKLMLIKEDKSLYQSCQEGCKTLARDYDREKLAEHMLAIIEDVVNKYKTYK